MSVALHTLVCGEEWTQSLAHLATNTSLKPAGGSLIMIYSGICIKQHIFRGPTDLHSNLYGCIYIYICMSYRNYAAKPFQPPPFPRVSAPWPARMSSTSFLSCITSKAILAGQLSGTTATSQLETLMPGFNLPLREHSYFLRPKRKIASAD